MVESTQVHSISDRKIRNAYKEIAKAVFGDDEFRINGIYEDYALFNRRDERFQITVFSCHPNVIRCCLSKVIDITDYRFPDNARISLFVQALKRKHPLGH